MIIIKPRIRPKSVYVIHPSWLTGGEERWFYDHFLYKIPKEFDSYESCYFSEDDSRIIIENGIPIPKSNDEKIKRIKEASVVIGVLDNSVKEYLKQISEDLQLSIKLGKTILGYKGSFDEEGLLDNLKKLMNKIEIVPDINSLENRLRKLI